MFLVFCNRYPNIFEHFLYLDSFDVIPGLEQESAEHNFNEFKAAEPYLHDLSIIVVDDYSAEKPGKGRITVPHLISLQGY